MEDDLIVVDDDETQPSTPDLYDPGPSSLRRPSVASHTMLRQSLRRRSTPPVYTDPPDPSEGRTTRSATRPKLQPKLKLKLSEKAAALAPGISFLGPYDRELDSDDEDLVFEEQFILRMPPGEDSEKMRKMVQTREVGNDVWFKFKDSRRAVFHIGNNTYSSKLVDLPCIVESQKTLDNKQMFKVADICQMLVVEDKIPSEDHLANNPRTFNVNEYVWPHGVTPPLQHVRKRRFRKRLARSTIETVEQEVERLLEEDALATQVQYEVLDNVNPDLSDMELMDIQHPIDAPTPGFAESEPGDAPTPAPGGEDNGEGGESGEEAEGDIDEELAAELDLALGDDEDGNEEEDDEEDDESDEEDEEEDDDDDETVQAKKLLNEEIRDLEAAVAKKNHEISSSANPLIKRRFEDALKKLQADLDMKHAQRDELKERQRLKKAGIVTGEDGDTEGADQEGEGEAAAEDGDLFGDDSDDMDVG